MKTQKQLKTIFIRICIASLIIAFFVESLCDVHYQSFIVSLLLGVFGSSLVSIALAIILQRDEAKKELLRLCVLSANTENLYHVYRKLYDLSLNQHEMVSVIDSLNRIRIEAMNTRHEIIQLQLENEWTDNEILKQDIHEYCNLLLEVQKQCELTSDYILFKINPESYTFNKSEQNAIIINEDYSKRLSAYTIKFDEFAGAYLNHRQNKD